MVYFCTILMYGGVTVSDYAVSRINGVVQDFLEGGWGPNRLIRSLKYAKGVLKFPILSGLPRN